MNSSLNGSVHERFAAQSRRTPDATALVVPSGSEAPLEGVTYRELDRRSGILAARLVALGVQRGDAVAVLMSRSVEMVTSLLGVLKAGAAYLPLDSACPSERLSFMLRDAQARLCLTDGTLANRLLPRDLVRPVMLGPEAETLNAVPASVAREPDDSAYLMYTSGSTGRPKGVIVPHRGILRLVLGNDYARLDGSRVLLQLAPISFDAATFEIWGALLHGGRCVLAPQTEVPDLAKLRRVIVETGVTTVWLTATLFNTIIDHSPETLETVQEVLTGGEALSVPHVRRALERLPQVQLINGYGPTESTTFACCYRIPRPLPADCFSIPIGPPISRTTVYLLDAERQAVPPGQPGEVYLGGDGLALGYLNDPELTAERFVTLPEIAGEACLYRTGDRARLLPGGAYEFLGRDDDQVKIRGYRVELGEIEAALCEQDGVGNAVVTTWQGIDGDRRLVAYCTAMNGRAPPAAEVLRVALSARLPDYMIPVRFIEVDRIPLTPNGKADRRALPQPGGGRPALEGSLVAPRTRTEEWVAGFWREVLGLDIVGVHDRFFELGGTSLAAVRLIALLSEVGGTSLPVLLIFRAPTIAEMAAALEDEYPGVLSGAASPPRDDPLAARAQLQRDALHQRRRRRRHAG